MTQDPEAGAATLAGFQRRYLRSLAHDRKPVVHVGEVRLSDAVIKALDEALEAHELVKIRLHQPSDKKASAAELAEKTSAHLCGLVGHTVILYRRHPKKPKIELPQRA